MWSTCLPSHTPEGKTNDITNNFHAALARHAEFHDALRGATDPNAMAVVIIDRADSRFSPAESIQEKP